LNEKLPDYEEELEEKEQRIRQERLFGMIDYMGGHPDYKEKAKGYILLKSDSLSYKTDFDSSSKMDVQILIDKMKGIEIRTNKEMTFFRWFLIGPFSILFRRKLNI
jgi:hypothetical protein